MSTTKLVLNMVFKKAKGKKLKSLCEFAFSIALSIPGPKEGEAGAGQLPMLKNTKRCTPQ